MKKNNLMKVGAILVVTSAIIAAGINSIGKDNIYISSNTNSGYLNNTIIKDNNKSMNDLVPYKNDTNDLTPIIKVEESTHKIEELIPSDSSTQYKTFKAPTLESKFVTVKGSNQYYEISMDYRVCGIACKNGVSGWELYVSEEGNPGNEIIIDNVGYFLHSDSKKENIITVITDFNKKYKYRARAYRDEKGKRRYSEWSEVVAINPVLKAPVLDNQFINVDNGKPTYDINIDYASYRIDEESYISGWELYVTTDENPGDEMIIDGVGYFFYGEFGNEAVTNVLTSFNETYKYRARVFIECEGGGRIYSDYSEIMSLHKDLKAPVLDNQFINVDNGRPTYDINIDYASYRTDEESYISGWELFVTKDENPVAETIIDGVGYFFYGEFGNETITNVLTSFNETYKYRARVFIECDGEKIYSDYSDVMIVSPKLKAPVLGNEYLETNDNISLYDVFIDYPSYRIDEENYLTGWELYVTTDENPGDEMIIDGVGYFLHSDNGNETVREIMVDNTRAYKYRARVYIENEEGRVYSNFSDIMTVTRK